MADRAAIVTGASSGIGLAVARMLAESGHAVTMAARRPQKLSDAFDRESLALLQAAAAEHRNALVLNMSSIAGKQGEAWLSIYSATKFGVVGFTQAMNRELGAQGIKSTAPCPAFVDTPMTDFVKTHVPAEAMIQTSDIVAAMRLLLELWPGCLIPEIAFQRPAGGPLESGSSF